MAAPPPLGDLVWQFAASVVVLAAFALLHARHAGVGDAGFTRAEAVVVLLVAPLASLVAVPLYRGDGASLAVNLGGFVIPVIVAVRLVIVGRAPPGRTALATLLVAVATYLVSTFIEGEGVRVFLPVPILLTVLLGVGFTLGRLRESAPLAYAAGTLGVVSGADLARLPRFLEAPSEGVRATTIGAAGTQDAVFLVGVSAVLLNVVLYWWFVARAGGNREDPPPP